LQEFGERGIVMATPKTELEPRNNDSFTAWRLYERTMTEIAPKFDAFVDASEKNRLAWASLEGSMRTQNFWLAALTLSTLTMAWRMW
jgi:hypothetical protein